MRARYGLRNDLHKQLDRAYASEHAQHPAEIPIEPFDPVGREDHRAHARVIAQIGEGVDVVRIVSQASEVGVPVGPSLAHGLPAVPA